MMRIVSMVASFGVGAAAWSVPRPAAAIGKFQKTFQKHYVDEHPDEEFATFVKRKARCYVCHQGKKKTNCNPYGKQFIELLDEKADKDDHEKVLAVLITVGKRRSDPDDPGSPTYDELIASSKLPGGPLEDVRKEPPPPPGQTDPPSDAGTPAEEDPPSQQESSDQSTLSAPVGAPSCPPPPSPHPETYGL